MTDSDVTIALLREIRESITNVDVTLCGHFDAIDHRLTGRFDVLIDRFDDLIERMSIVEHTLRDIGAQMRMLMR